MSRVLPIVVASVLAVACASTPGGRVASSPPAAAEPSVQSLYESGQDAEIVNRVAGRAAASADLWFAAQSKLRLGQRDEAIGDLMTLQASGDAGVAAAARLAVARLTGDDRAIEATRAEASMYTDSLFAQYELGVSYAARNEYAAAARAFDRCIEIAPAFAYAYYQSALVYERLSRPDVMANRLDRFMRLAPNAPERPQVESILRTVGGRT